MSARTVLTVPPRDLQVTAANIVIDLAEGRWPDGCVVNLRGIKDWRW